MLRRSLRVSLAVVVNDIDSRMLAKAHKYRSDEYAIPLLAHGELTQMVDVFLFSLMIFNSQHQ